VKGPIEDSPWVYVGGGDTRIVSVRGGSNFQELVKQLGVFCRKSPIVRYKLPGEEMMVSVYTDQDVQLMFEEWDLWRRWKDWPVRSSSSKKLHIYVCDTSEVSGSGSQGIHGGQETTVGIPASEFYNKPPSGALAPAELLKLSNSSTLDNSEDSRYFSFSKSGDLSASMDGFTHVAGNESPKKCMSPSFKPPLSPTKPGTVLDSPKKMERKQRTKRLSGTNTKDKFDRSWSPMGRSVSPFAEKLSGFAQKLKRPSHASRSSEQSASGFDNVVPGPRAPPFVPNSSSRSSSANRSRASSPDNDLWSSGDSACANDEERRERWRVAHAAMADSEAHSAAAALRDNMELQLIHPNELEGLQRVGAGGYGEVHRGHWKGLEVAIKTIFPKLFVEQEGHNITSRSLCAAHVADFCREAQLISSLQHPNVVRVYGVVQGQRSPAIVTEYVERSLRHILDRQPCALGQRKRLNLALEAARGMEYLHSRRIVHFDFKSSNTLIGIGQNSQMTLKVCDFGLAKHKRQTCAKGSNSICSTLPWTAPEVVRNPENITEKVDVFSFGIVMWELWTSKTPHAGMDSTAIIGGLLFSELRPPIPSSDGLVSMPPPHPRWKELMCKCWNEDPLQRPSFDAIATELEQMCTKRF